MVEMRSFRVFFTDIDLQSQRAVCVDWPVGGGRVPSGDPQPKLKSPDVFVQRLHS